MINQKKELQGIGMSLSMLTRYERARSILVRYGHMLKPKCGENDHIIRNDTVYPHWISHPDGSESGYFWYRRETAKGKEYCLVDIEAKNSFPAFDHVQLAKLLSEVKFTAKISSGESDPIREPKNQERKGDAQSLVANASEKVEAVNPLDLPLTSLDIKLTKENGTFEIYFKAIGRCWYFNPQQSILEETALRQAYDFPSPDGKKSAFVREHNIWLKDLTSGNERPLTTDGSENYAYGTGSSTGYDDSLLWSSDSKNLLFAKFDQRESSTWRRINYVPQGKLQPEYDEWRWSFPGDESIANLQYFVVNINEDNLQQASYPGIPDMFYGMFREGISAGTAWWSVDNQRVFFIDTPRDVRTVRVMEWDTHSGGIRVVFEETDEVAIRLRHDILSFPIIAPLQETDELIWFSERSGWGHLYLYDLNSGELKHQITGTLIDKERAKDKGVKTPEWMVHSILHVDAEQRELLIRTSARNPKINPYYRDICKVNIDSGLLTPLLSENYEHRVHQCVDGSTRVYMRNNFDLSPHTSIDIRRIFSGGISPSGQYLVVTRSRADSVPESILIDRDGQKILTIETADVSNLPLDWQWPETVKLKASDDETDIYAVVFRPPDFSPTKSYPVIDFLSSTRGFNTLPTGSFINSTWQGHAYFLAAAQAALGFVVVCISGRGTTGRDKPFYTHHYGDHAFTSDLDDRIAGIRQLAKRYPYMDLDRVGINGNENPNNNAICGALLHSEFYKVAVIQCLADPRFSGACLTEPLEMSLSDSAPKRTPYPEYCVESFDGKLLLIQGLRGQPNPCYRLVNALVEANKNVDMLCVPNLFNSISPYTVRREWDYFVTNLQGGEPPKGFVLTAC